MEDYKEEGSDSKECGQTAVEMGYWRRSCGITRLYKIGIQRLKAVRGTETMEHRVHVNWCEHMKGLSKVRWLQKY